MESIVSSAYVDSRSRTKQLFGMNGSFDLKGRRLYLDSFYSIMRVGSFDSNAT